MESIYRYSREELLEIGRKDLNELVDFTLGLQKYLRIIEGLQKQIKAMKAEMVRRGLSD